MKFKLWVMLSLLSSNVKSAMPSDFVFLNDIDPSITIHIRYATTDNFVGRPIDGYQYVNKTVCTRQAAQALKAVQDELQQHGYKLVVYDAYRPQRASDEFMKWSQDVNDQIMKLQYYPALNKADVFKEGYVAKQSRHSGGSTFDVTIIEKGKELKPLTYSQRTIKTGQKIPFLDDATVDMGSSFDLFHPVSHHDTTLIDKSFTQKRNFLRNIMKKYGFQEYKEEWWHYTLKDEPYPRTCFNFVI